MNPTVTSSRYIVRIPAFRIDTANLLRRLAAIFKVPESDLAYEWDGVRKRQDHYPSGYYLVTCRSEWDPMETPLTSEHIKSLRLPRVSASPSEEASALPEGSGRS